MKWYVEEEKSLSAFWVRPLRSISHKDIVQIHGFYYSEKENTISVDVVPDITVHDEKALVNQLISDIQPLVPGTHLEIIVDHNYSE